MLVVGPLKPWICAHPVKPGEHLCLCIKFIISLEKCFICPVTNKLLDTTFRNLTPYLPNSFDSKNFECKSIDLPPIWTLDISQYDYSEGLKKIRQSVSADEKVSGLSAIMKKAGFSGLLVNFVGVMARNGRSQDILGAQIAFDELYAKQRGVKRAVVRTAKEMSGAERQRIESILAKAVGGEVELSSEVDPSLIGGIQLRIGSQLVDASLAAKLDRMNTAMKGA